jgi:hypothetical protein
VIIRFFDEGFGTQLREQLAWSTAAIIVGLPVWILPWRQVQARAVERGSTGVEARGSTVRKIYLYLFLFAATMTVLSSAVYILFKILSWMLGADAPTLSELGHAIALSVIAVGVWLYHGFVLRGDYRLSGQAQAVRMEDLRLAVVDVGEGQFGRAVVEALKRETPGLDLEPIVLGQLADGEVSARLTRAGLIVGPWSVAVVGGAEGAVSATVAQAVTSSPAQKLLVPSRVTGWDWAGVERWSAEVLVRQTVRAIGQIAAGEEVRPARPLSIGSVAGIVVGVLFLLIVVLALIGPAIGNLFD